MKYVELELPSNRKFGFFFSFVFFGLTIYLFFTSIYFVWASTLALSALLFVITLIKDQLLLPLNRLWMRLGFILGIIISPIVLGVIFFGIFAPVGILMRIFGRDELGLKVKKSGSHWKDRDHQVFMKDSFKNQF